MAPRVGLLTRALHTNYGGVLQASAPYSILSDLGCEVVLLEHDTPWPRKNLELAAEPVDFEAVDKILLGLKSRSMDFLKRALQ